MVTERLDIRLDPERRRKLADLSKSRGVSTSMVVREAIDYLYELAMRERRLQAAARIAAMNIEDLPDPQELKRQMNEAYGDRPVP